MLGIPYTPDFIPLSQQLLFTNSPLLQDCWYTVQILTCPVIEFLWPVRCVIFLLHVTSDYILSFFVGFFPLSHRCFKHCLVSVEIADLHERTFLWALGYICPMCLQTCSSHGFAILSLKASKRKKEEEEGEGRKRRRDWGREREVVERPRTVSLAEPASPLHSRWSTCK